MCKHKNNSIIAYVLTQNDLARTLVLSMSLYALIAGKEKTVIHNILIYYSIKDQIPIKTYLLCTY